MEMLCNLFDTVYLLLQQEAKTFQNQFAVTQELLCEVPEKASHAIEKPLTVAEL